MGIWESIKEWYFKKRYEWDFAHHHYDEAVYDQNTKEFMFTLNITAEDWHCIVDQYRAEVLVYGKMQSMLPKVPRRIVRISE